MTEDNSRVKLVQKLKRRLDFRKISWYKWTTRHPSLPMDISTAPLNGFAENAEKNVADHSQSYYIKKIPNDTLKIFFPFRYICKLSLFYIALIDVLESTNISFSCELNNEVTAEIKRFISLTRITNGYTIFLILELFCRIVNFPTVSLKMILKKKRWGNISNSRIEIGDQ